MKKKLTSIVAGSVVGASLLFGGTMALASSWGWINFPNGAELQYESVDNARLDLYSSVQIVEDFNGNYTIKPEHIVKSITDARGNSVDFSALEVTYQLIKYDQASRQYVYEDISSENALKSDGTFNLEKHGSILTTYSYSYPVPYLASPTVYSTIEKTVLVDVAIF
ncbi:hypothetical protein [Candidatus Enterococcus clewellii]|uniref:Uncharacterized protein n=1 Tax=Candidatus Enterococcus clewellii TaxID=1834193 RepID=A0A242KBE2_9ENTE|nr:hypothetical protein [Enterococcus sp. 9E7_DIV0242]OTP18377.1 hypothetical protein A5888_000191 [Enterococcus sp. 9E7_DIV0242]